ncbi:uncharacterized protein LOC111399773 [Olea europaea var. sylvestris]|uniref:uncharacterized protein LOC111399773 n=1 Tax=Olea europaea var. sylvestris TaxID=158386 RepID=UPI000C1D84B8|nr:uncharacterized protein LOC111399773 [Olea europaea var. sylvestris]XP_022883019.1 uncharacterized protein LOC111399773 [Olea europaea var. sylvestris]
MLKFERECRSLQPILISSMLLKQPKSLIFRLERDCPRMRSFNNLPCSASLKLLIHTVGIGTIYISIAISGSKDKGYSISFPGWMLEMEKYQILRSAHRTICNGNASNI